MTKEKLIYEIAEKELYLKCLDKKREETERRIAEWKAELETLEGKNG